MTLERKPWNVKGYTCVKCGHHFDKHMMYACEKCGTDGILEIDFDYAKIKASTKMIDRDDRTIWRYSQFLPIDDFSIKPFLTAGGTPVYDVPRLAERLGIERLWLKDEGRNPTASFKDRASCVGAVKAIEYGQHVVACASTGNAACSMAGAAAALGLKAVIFVPEKAPDPKIAQLLIYGATVFKVQGSYADATNLCNDVCQAYGWYNRNCAINPYLIEGKKTGGLEMAEQLAATPPDWVVVSVGDGCTFAGIWKGFKEMKEVGVLSKLPRMLGVQAELANPISVAWRTGKDLLSSRADTIADSICVGEPANWRKAIKAVRDSEGVMIDVSDDAILEAMREVGIYSGVFGEPAASAAYAGLQKAVGEGLVKPSETAAVFITGNGLKDIKSGMKAAGSPRYVKPKDVATVGEIVKRA